jgi:hypothetical protein
MRQLGLVARPVLQAARIVVAVAIVSMPTACSDASPTTPRQDSGAGLALRYTCGSFSFTPDVLASGPGHDERRPGAPAAALRRYLDDPARSNPWVPAAGWHLLGADGHRAEFAVQNADHTMWDVMVRSDGPGWEVSSPVTCQPRLSLPAGLGRADWILDPTLPPPPPTATGFTALVTERSCSGGRSADDRIVGPQVVRSQDVVLVIFVIRRSAAVATCPPNPATRVAVDLGGPLGVSSLLDGGRLPFGDPTQPG